MVGVCAEGGSFAGEEVAGCVVAAVEEVGVGLGGCGGGAWRVLVKAVQQSVWRSCE